MATAVAVATTYRELPVFVGYLAPDCSLERPHTRKPEQFSEFRVRRNLVYRHH